MSTKGKVDLHSNPKNIEQKNVRPGIYWVKTFQLEVHR